MRAGLRQRFGWRTSLDAGIAVPGSRVAMAQGAAWFAAVAAVLGVAVVVLPLPPAADELGLAATALACGLLAAVALRGRRTGCRAWCFTAGALRGDGGRRRAATHYWGEGSFVRRRCRSCSRWSTPPGSCPGA